MRSVNGVTKVRVQRRKFRIENGYAGAGVKHVGDLDVDTSRHHAEIMGELRVLRRCMEPREQMDLRILDSYKQQLAEAMKLKAELDLISDAINKTKHEIATVHVTGFEGPEMTRVTHELDAVIDGTEQATDKILCAAEEIDQLVNTLGAGLKSVQEKGMISDVQDRVIKIFEACNFQDLTGQRINKVVATLKFIEEHILRMTDIWGGL
ncbi:MAG: protein phosphatase CheZ, partial [Proteobacteria bacterium]|nr:protein phosphatase CheZ [Pseudomonadota bacterium]